MAFDTGAAAPWLGNPVHLFIIRRQHITHRLASGTRDVVVGEHTYYAAQIERDAIRQTAERAKDRLKIRMAYLTDPAADEYPITQAIGDWWRPHIPNDPITVVCLATEYGAIDPPRVEWTGWAVGPSYTDTQLELTCDPNPPHGNNQNQGPKWQRACWKTVYSTGIRGCNLPEHGYASTVTLSGASGTTLTAAAFAGPHKRTLVGGRITWLDEDEALHERAITAHAGTTVTIAGAIDDMPADAEVTLYTRGFWVHGEVDAIDGLVLTVPDFIGTEFSLLGGTLYWVRPDGLREERPVMGHNQATGAVTLLWGGDGLEEGLAVSALPNCPNTWAACAARRPDPELHFGGAIYKPVQDPITQGVSMSWG
ncbi:DUF2163 domain-containing protein [Luteimonas composti]|uniref:DUF2163 domain-containing protein n=1 Tax=Luteimonas composti TaxID=398257 RepID=A0ABT6MSH1_9GAMM|nr:DUF2163 domain-containing protein [Luteimonas composti]MDH7453589.1 DUF2163 domain-containing protein [Luteimonas composti]